MMALESLQTIVENAAVEEMTPEVMKNALQSLTMVVLDQQRVIDEMTAEKFAMDEPPPSQEHGELTGLRQEVVELSRFARGQLSVQDQSLSHLTEMINLQQESTSSAVRQAKQVQETSHAAQVSLESKMVRLEMKHEQLAAEFYGTQLKSKTDPGDSKQQQPMESKPPPIKPFAPQTSVPEVSAALERSPSDLVAKLEATDLHGKSVDEKIDKLVVHIAHLQEKLMRERQAREHLEAELNSTFAMIENDEANLKPVSPDLKPRRRVPRPIESYSPQTVSQAKLKAAQESAKVVSRVMGQRDPFVSSRPRNSQSRDSRRRRRSPLEERETSPDMGFYDQYLDAPEDQVRPLTNVMPSRPMTSQGILSPFQRKRSLNQPAPLASHIYSEEQMRNWRSINRQIVDPVVKIGAVSPQEMTGGDDSLLPRPRRFGNSPSRQSR